MIELSELSELFTLKLADFESSLIALSIVIVYLPFTLLFCGKLVPGISSS